MWEITENKCTVSSPEGKTEQDEIEGFPKLRMCLEDTIEPCITGLSLNGCIIFLIIK